MNPSPILNDSTLRALFDSALDIMVIADDEGCCVDVNPASYRLFGLPKEELIGRSGADFTEPGFDFHRAWQKFLQQGQSQSELRLLHSDGTFRVVELSANANFIPQFHLFILRDITNHKRIEIRQQMEQALKESEAELQGLFRTMDKYIFILDNKGKYIKIIPTKANVSAKLYQTLHEHFSRDIADDFLETIQLVCGTQQATSLEYSLTIASQELWFSTCVSPLSETTVLWVAENITARKQAEIALQSSQKRYHELIHSINGVVWEYDPYAYIFTFMSKKAEELFGFPLERWLTEPYFWGTCLHPEDREEAIAFCEKATALCQNHEFEYRLITADGRILWIHELVTIVQEENCPLRLRGLMVDNTERKKMQLALEEFNKELESKVEERTEKLAAQMKELEQLSLLKDDFLSTVSHELRTPLSNINMIITMLKKNIKPERREFYLQSLEAECNREKELINDLLDLQRLDSGRSQLFLEEIQIFPWLTRLLSPFESLGFAQNQQFTLDIDPSLSTMITDRSMLERLIVELVNNASKYASIEKGIIKVEVYKLNSEIVFSVFNNGPTIPTESIKLIFDKFYRVPSYDPWRRGGTGLGLALVKQLVTQLQGKIQVTSLNQETCFVVTFPLHFVCS